MIYPYDIKRRVIQAALDECRKIDAEIDGLGLDPEAEIAARQTVIEEMERLDIEFGKLGVDDSGVIDDRQSWGKTLGDSPAEG